MDIITYFLIGFLIGLAIGLLYFWRYERRLEWLRRIGAGD